MLAVERFAGQIPVSEKLPFDILEGLLLGQVLLEGLLGGVEHHGTGGSVDDDRNASRDRLADRLEPDDGGNPHGAGKDGRMRSPPPDIGDKSVNLLLVDLHGIGGREVVGHNHDLAVNLAQAALVGAGKIAQ